MFQDSSSFYTEKTNVLAYDNRLFDSALELKYILMVEDTHAWLKDGLDIYFDLHLQRSAAKTPFKKYIPDFLVRDWQTGKATLVEIKPDRYDDILALRNRTKIANHHIKEFGYDWEYEIIFASQIKLTDPQYKKFSRIISENRNRKTLPYCFDEPPSNCPTRYSSKDYQHFVLTGVVPAFVP